EGPIDARLARIDLPLEKPDREAFEKMAATGKPEAQRFSREQLRKMEDGSLPTSISYPIQVIQFGHLTMICLAGETCVEYALRLKQDLTFRRHPFSHLSLRELREVWVTGYSNEVMCYIPSERVLK